MPGRARRAAHPRRGAPSRDGPVAQRAHVMPHAEFSPGQHEAERQVVHIVWMTSGLGCDGDTVAMTAATNPSLEDLLTGAIPGMPGVVIYNPMIAYETAGS